MSCGCSEAPCSSLASRRFSFLCTGGVRPRRNLRRRLRRFEFWEAVMSSTAKTVVRAYQNYINGQWVKSSSGEMFPVFDPSTEEVIAHAASATAADVDHAVKSARAAFDSGPWRETSARSEEHTSELQSQSNIVCRLLLEKKKKKKTISLQSIYATYSLPDEYRHMVA